MEFCPYSICIKIPGKSTKRLEQPSNEVAAHHIVRGKEPGMLEEEEERGND